MPEFTDAELLDIQGHLLSAFAHLRYAEYVFLEVKDRKKAQRWLASVIPSVTTSERWKPGQKPRQLINVQFTHDGLAAMQLPQEALYSFTREYIQGIQARAHLLGDHGESAPENWGVGGPNNAPVHILLTLNADSPEQLEKLTKEQIGRINGDSGLSISALEDGSRHESDKEPFGWLDGLAQPKIQRMRGYPDDINNVAATGEFILGYQNETGAYPISPWVNPEHDPGNILRTFPKGSGELDGKKDFGFHGTYFIYRKLHQDVATFWNYFIDQAGTNAAGEPDIQKAIYLASKSVGRWPSGASMAMAPNEDDHELGHDKTRHDNFLYDDIDPHGHGCPIGSHVRRCNPRDSRTLEPDNDFALGSTDKHRIIRRASDFGSDIFPREGVEFGKIPYPVADDGKERGLHFFAMNASIRAQFEFIQIVWANNAYFDGTYEMKDPLIGDNDGTGQIEIPAKPVRRRMRNVPRFVHVRGGGYFFMPSMTSLRYLAEMP